MELQLDEEKTIGTTSEVISVEKGNGNVSRTDIIITNTSTGGQLVRLAFGKEAVNGIGIPIYAGGHWERVRGDTFKPTQKQIQAISDAAGATLSIHEEVQ